MVRLSLTLSSLILLGLCGIALCFNPALAPDSDGSPSSLAIDPPKLSLPLSRLMSRRLSRRDSQGQCAASNYTACGQGLPSNFCCLSTSTCLALAANTTAVCCPAGSTCHRIRVTACEVRFFNVSAFPTSPILTLALTSNMPQCGPGCCPFGYSCEAGNNTCIRNADQSLFNTGSTALPVSSAPATTPPPSPPASPSPAPSSPAGAAASSDESSRPNISGMIAGSATAAVFSVISLAAVAWMKRRSISKFARRYGPDVSWPLSKENPPPPPPKPRSMLVARGSRLEWRSRHPPLKALSPVELPATPISFKMWGSKRRPKLSIPKPIFSPPPTVDSRYDGGFI